MDAPRIALPPVSTAPLHDPLPFLREGIAIFRRRRKVFGIAFGAMLALVVILVLTTPKTYSSQASVIVGMGRQQTQGDAPTNLPILNALMVVSGIQSGETFSELMTEAPVAREVIDRLNLRATANQLLAHVKAEPVNNTSIIRLTATWSTRDLSAQIANAFADAFISRERDLVAGQATTSMNFLSEELPAAARRQHVTEAALSAFQKRHQLADVDSQTNATIAALTSLDVKAAQLTLDERQASAQLRSNVSQLGGTATTAPGSQSVAPNPVVEQLRTQLATVETQLAEARRTYTESHPAVIALEQQLAAIKREIAREPSTVVSGASTVVNPVYEQLSEQAAGYRTQIAADQAGLTELQVQRQSLLAQVRALPDEAMQFAALQRDAKQAEAVYAALQGRMNDAMIAKSTAISDVTITQRADPADAVARPSRTMLLLVGFFVSLALAASLVALLEYLDRREKSEREIRASFGTKILGAIPDLGYIDTQSRPGLRAMAIESLLQIVRMLRFSSPRRACSIAFTSPRLGDGKSTVAVNVARTLAELEAPVLIIDGDLRRPSLHRLLKVPNGPGFSDVLAGTSRLEACIQKTEVTGLDVLTSGLPVTAPAHVLHSIVFPQLLVEAKDLGYRTIIVDLPAVLPVVDAALLAEKVDGTVMVVSVDKSDGEFVRESVEYAHRVGIRNLIGLIVNRVRREPDRDGSSYYMAPEGAPLALP
jgi:polysaccharide biosynthesis transport protein